jgi:hypothetical protein
MIERWALKFRVFLKPKRMACAVLDIAAARLLNA